MTKKFLVEVTMTVVVEIPDDVLTEAATPGHGRNQYGFTSESDVAEHLAYNRVANGEVDGHILDGFADTGETISMEIESHHMDFHTMEIHKA